MRKKRIIAMLLAGGQGTRLSVLTNRMAKPAVPFGGKYRIIDFPLSNCTNSDIDTVGVLTQYEPLELNAYIGTGQAWDLDRNDGGVYVLPPYVKGSHGEWYSGTANAIYQNMDFIERFDPDHVLVLSGDHIYKMDYARMLRFHIEKQADATIAVLKVKPEDASRFGIMNADQDDRIIDFAEKPKEPKSNKASMGIYVFSWPVLKEALARDAQDLTSENDFGKNVIPAMIKGQKRLFAYPFEGYWKDVGTIQSLWEANMDMLELPPELDLNDKEWRIYSKNPNLPAHYAGESANITNSLICEGCMVYGTVEHSVIFAGVTIEKNTVIRDSVVLSGAAVREGAVINKAILGENTVIGKGSVIGAQKLAEDGEYDASLTGDITLIASDTEIEDGARVPVGMIVSRGR
jgi:glucose-1-phosphate adenylyltransferase